ncbi:MAG: hypothetical protein HQ522_16650 [Bacteroidetes bacterium]|nr:hypothetical protein [Bacteroidota bacterium]
MLHISQIHKLVEPAGTEFSIRFITKIGYEVFAEKCVCTSFHSSGRTLNIKFLPSNQIRKIRRCTITEFNNEEVVL